MDKKISLEKLSRKWIAENRSELIKRFCSDDKHAPSETPFTIFMAGTPGAGKTEFSVSLISQFPEPIVRIDADEIRELFRPMGYNGSNADQVQKAAIKGVEILHDYALHKSQNILLDGTFAYKSWRKNIDRSLKKGRPVEIYFLYQDPAIAWGFCVKRAERGGRVVPPRVFVDSYFSSIQNVEKAKNIFGGKIQVHFAVNNYQDEPMDISVNVASVENLLPKRYTKDEIERITHG